VFGTTSAIQSTLGAVAPIVAGYWYDHHGSYRPIFVAAGLLCAVASVALALISPPVRYTPASSSLPNEASRVR
jgi:MFS family permease